MSAAAGQQRWTAQHPCPVCGHHEREPRGRGQRCAGYLCVGGKTAICTRDEHAGQLPLDSSKQPAGYVHSLRGTCACGIPHALGAGAAEPDAQRIDMVYPYRDEAGTVLYETVRFWPKDFRQRRPDPSKRSGFTWNMRGVRRVPYRLPELLADSKRLLCICEGEADCDALRELGLPATCNVGGAGKWGRAESELIPKHRAPVLLLDNDEAGERHGEAAAHALRAAGFRPRVLRFTDDLPEHGDVRDWLAAGHGRDELMARLKAAPEYTPFTPYRVDGAAVSGNGNANGHHGNGHNGSGSGDERPVEEFVAFTDTRNALRLVRSHGERLRRDHTRGLWRIYDGTVWRLDETEQVMRYAKDIVAKLKEEIPDSVHPRRRESLEDDALACESTGRLRAMIQNAASELATTHESWDPDPFLLNTLSGTVCLRTGEAHPHRQEDMCARICPVAYDPQRPTPKWDAFLDRIFAGDTELIAFVQRAVGLSLLGRVLEHVLFICYGTGANGKSQFLKVFHNILGDYARTAARDILLHHDRPQHLTVIAELAGARFVSTVESTQGSRLDEGMVKALTGGDPRNANFMFHDHFTYIPSDTFWIATNHKPQITDFTVGLRRRLRFIPFTVQIPPEDDVKEYAEVLRDEYPGILAWAVQGAVAYLRTGLGTAARVDATTQSFWLDADTLEQFLDERCKRDPSSLVPAGQLYDAYRDWATANGELGRGGRPVSQAVLGRRLAERGFERVRHGKLQRWHWRGLRLRGDDELPDDDPPPEPPDTKPPAGRDPAPFCDAVRHNDGPVRGDFVCGIASANIKGSAISEYEADPLNPSRAFQRTHAKSSEYQVNKCARARTREADPGVKGSASGDFEFENGRPFAIGDDTTTTEQEETDMLTAAQVAEVHDPRPDLAEDSRTWRVLLALARLHEGSAWGVEDELRGLRVTGAELSPDPNGVWRIAPRPGTEDAYQQAREYAAADRESVAALLLRLPAVLAALSSDDAAAPA